MTKSSIFATLALVAAATQIKAQPDPGTFRFGHLYVQAEAGSSTSFYSFRKSGETILSEKRAYRGKQPGAVFEASERVLIADEMSRASMLYGLHLVNSKGEDVYVYVYAPYTSPVERLAADGTSAEFIHLDGSDAVLIEKADLKKGTYLIDWSDRSSSGFHTQIAHHVGEERKKLKQWKDSLQLQQDERHLQTLTGTAD
jgi:hypothetical protein